MIRIAIVDDDEAYRLQAKEYVELFSKESGEPFLTAVWTL